MKWTSFFPFKENSLQKEKLSKSNFLHLFPSESEITQSDLWKW